MTKLVVPITLDDVNVLPVRLARAAAAGADAVELRVDRLPCAPAELAEVIVASPLPLIVTCRHASEKGGYEGSNLRRAQWLGQLLGYARPWALDVELAHWQADEELRQALIPYLSAETGDGGVELILSYHDFEGRPSDLADRLAACVTEPLCCYPKLAWMAKNQEDTCVAMRLLATSPKPAVALAMGEMGMPSRILAPLAGGAFTFATLDESTAPGQPSLSDMLELYRFREITPETPVYAVVGDPVGHSKSPLVHNAALAALGLPGVYVPLRIAPDHLRHDLGAWLDCPQLRLRGVSVTIPHKEELLELVDERGGVVDPQTRAIGAGNTLSVAQDGSLQACNTDMLGLLGAILDGAGRKDLNGIRAAVVGTGGVARPAVAGLKSAGAEITVYGRTPEKVFAVSEDFEVHGENLHVLKTATFDLLVNATPLGMDPDVESSVLSANHPSLRPGVVVFDTVYTPRETRLLKDAAARGAKPLSGEDMFLRQAVAQFVHWTGADPVQVTRVMSDTLLEK